MGFITTKRMALMLHNLQNSKAGIINSTITNASPNLKHQKFLQAPQATNLYKSFDITRQEVQKAAEAALSSAGFWYIPMAVAPQDATL